MACCSSTVTKSSTREFHRGLYGNGLQGSAEVGLTAFLIDRDGKVQNKNVNGIYSLDDLFERESW